MSRPFPLASVCAALSFVLAIGGGPCRPASVRAQHPSGVERPGRRASRDANASEAPPAPAREFRAAWVSPIWAGGMRDWPSTPGLPADSQKAELRALLDRARDLGLNAVILHVRTAGDALYPSPFAPWSAMLSGTSGVPPEPYYDPLAFAVAEAHARGLQLHAWFNPFRATIAESRLPPGPTHVTRVHPEWVVRYGPQSWIDPGQPAARRAVLDAILDVVRRYDIDGVHLDDYFYPYREPAPVHVSRHGRRRGGGDLPFPDDASWRRYGRARGWTSRADWRRANVDDFVRTLYAEVKATKRSVVVGISPFGIWRSGTPAGVTGLDAYGELYADARKWLANGWVDYLAPQLYWELDGPQDRFRRLDAWWRAQNRRGRHVWPGLQSARVASGSTRWSDVEIPGEIAWLREASAATHDAPGHVHFRMAAVADPSAASLGARLHDAVYAAPALVPASPWLGAAVPGAPRATMVDARSALRLQPGDATPVAWWLLQWREPDGWRSALRHAGDAPTIPMPDAAVGPLFVSAVSPTGELGPRTRVPAGSPVAADDEAGASH